jgi:D-alanine--D-alanine ligase
MVFQRLKKLGAKIVVAHPEKNWAQPYVDDWILTSTQNLPQLKKAVAKYLELNQVDGILTFWVYDVISTAYLCHELGFTGHSLQVAELAQNKYAFRQFSRDHDLPAPKHMLIKNNQDLTAAQEQLQFPVVFKPIYGSSSAYVIKVDRPEELTATYHSIERLMPGGYETDYFQSLELMVEEYIDGEEVDIDMVLQNGKVKYWSVADNYQTKEPYFMETGYALPSALPDETQQSLVDLAETTLEQMGVMNGVVHFEAKSTEKGPVALEVNLRMGGDEIYSSNKSVWGMDLIEAAALVACGVHLPKQTLDPTPKTFIAGQSLLAEKSGLLTSVTIPEKLPDYVKEFHFDAEVGDTILTPPHGFDFLGWVTVDGDNLNDAKQNLAELMSMIEYEIAPFSELSSLGKTQRKNQSSAAYLSSGSIKGQARIERVRRVDRSHQKNLTIGIACNEYDAQQGSVEAELSNIGKLIQTELEQRGYQTIFIDFNNLDKAIATLKKGNIDLVFNVGERIHNSSLLEPHVAAILDAFQIPYTGSSPFTLSFCIDKIRVKKLLAFHQIPTAKWDYAYSLDDEIRTDLAYPIIVKPGNTDNSIGITQNSVVTNPQELKQQMEYVLTELKRPALVEEYLEGDEYDVSILGSEEDDLRVLPLSRSIFDKLPDDMWHIFSFDAKFAEEKKFKSMLEVQQPPKKVSSKLLSLIGEIALDTYTILDCHDYGRVEVKLDKNNNPHVLELNPNPSINITDTVPRVAKLAGLEYGDLLEEIIAMAIKRYKNRPPYYHLQPSLR